MLQFVTLFFSLFIIGLCEESSLNATITTTKKPKKCDISEYPYMVSLISSPTGGSKRSYTGIMLSSNWALSNDLYNTDFESENSTKKTLLTNRNDNLPTPKDTGLPTFARHGDSKLGQWMEVYKFLHQNDENSKVYNGTPVKLPPTKSFRYECKQVTIIGWDTSMLSIVNTDDFTNSSDRMTCTDAEIVDNCGQILERDQACLKLNSDQEFSSIMKFRPVICDGILLGMTDFCVDNSPNCAMIDIATYMTALGNVTSIPVPFQYSLPKTTEKSDIIFWTRDPRTQDVKDLFDASDTTAFGEASDIPKAKTTIDPNADFGPIGGANSNVSLHFLSRSEMQPTCKSLLLSISTVVIVVTCF